MTQVPTSVDLSRETTLFSEISPITDEVASKQNIYTLLKISSIVDTVTGETKSKDDIQKFLKYE